MTYTDADHRAATARMRAAQADRPIGEDDARALESMAPENTGKRRERAGSVLVRARFALTEHDSRRRRARIRGEQP